jgi:hypothetical protein
MTASPETHAATVATNGAPTVAKRRGGAVERFPLKAHTRISIAMHRSLQRLTGGNSLFSESVILRLALHQYLIANEPNYTREVSNGQFP